MSMTSVCKRRKESSTSWTMRALLALRYGLPSFQAKPTLVAMTACLRRPFWARGLADNLFRAAEAVDRRRVDEIDPAIERRVNRSNRFILFRATPHSTADRPGSKCDARHFEGCGEIFHLGVVRSVLRSHSSDPFFTIACLP